MQTFFKDGVERDPATQRSEAIFRSCVHCGLCTGTCPTYQLLGDELDSPRGRIYLLKDMLENDRKPTKDVVEHLDRCLSCLACTTTCPSGVQGADGTCSSATEELSSMPWNSKQPQSDDQDHDQDHMALAARYYRMAAEEHDSARANFNLGFMHEFGLGLKQDFPLAKRHYDLCAASRHGEAELAVQVALFAMGWHQQVVRWRLAWDEWRELGTISSDSSPLGKAQAFIFRSWDKLRGKKAASDGTNRTKLSKSGRTDARKRSITPRSFHDIMISHLLSWETVVILLLTIFIARLLTDRVERQQRAQW